jgi:2-methylcitrate dehydratase PrpD
MLEGAQGFYAAMCPDPRSDALTADPEGPWLAWETSFKPWPACRHAHAAIDACLALRDRLPEGRGIAAVELLTYADALAFCDRPAPRTTAEAKFSLQHAAAVALCDGPPPLGAFAAEALGRPDLAALRAKVTVAAGEPFAGAYPARFGAAATALLDDGTRLRAEIPDALGDPENPLAERAVEAKARTLMEAAGVAPSRAAALVAAARALGEGGAPAELSRALAAALAPKDPS